jgi:hypothetical protein
LFSRPRDRGVNSARLVPLARRVSKCKSSTLEVEPLTRAPAASFMREEEVGDPIVLQARCGKCKSSALEIEPRELQSLRFISERVLDRRVTAGPGIPAHLSVRGSYRG